MMAASVAIVYLIGWLVTVVIDRHRVGVSQSGHVGLETVLSSLPWVLTTFGKMLFWPIVLAVWLAQGRPGPRWRATTSRNGTLKVVRKPLDSDELSA